MRNPRTLVAQAATAESMQPFGELVEWSAHAGAQRAINAGTSLRRDWPQALHSTDPKDRHALALFAAQARAWPFDATALEVHRLGSQTFLPLGVATGTPAFVVLLALPTATGGIDESSLRALLCHGGQGISLRAGVWHHPLLSVVPASYAVIERADAANDCTVQPLNSVVQVALPDRP